MQRNEEYLRGTKNAVEYLIWEFENGLGMGYKVKIKSQKSKRSGSN